MNAATTRAYRTWRRAVEIEMNRAFRNTPSTYAEDVKRQRRIAQLKEIYETALAAEKAGTTP